MKLNKNHSQQKMKAEDYTQEGEFYEKNAVWLKPGWKSLVITWVRIQCPKMLQRLVTPNHLLSLVNFHSKWSRNIWINGRENKAKIYT